VTDVRTFRSCPAEHLTTCRPVAGPLELAAHHRIRRAVFVTEQGLFPGSDRDQHDDEPATVHLLGLVDGEPAGTVRLYPLTGALWHGDRLAVLPEFRRSRIGAQLVQLAVTLAGDRGGTRMQARIQLPNVRFFERLGWRPTAPPADHLGIPHQWMAIPLRADRGVSIAARNERGAERPAGAKERQRADRGVSIAARNERGAERPAGANR
jgi:putative N-acetyltransferase (TIGR04045 family)